MAIANRYSVGGRMNAATAATADHVAVNLWNPSGSKSLWVVSVEFFNTTATAMPAQLIRTSTAGTTPGSTVTPDADNAYNRQVTPASGALAYTAAFSGAQPTVQGPPIKRTNLAAAIGTGMIWAFYDTPIEVPAGTGLALSTPAATAFQVCDFAFEWDE